MNQNIEAMPAEAQKIVRETLVKFADSNSLLTGYKLSKAASELAGRYVREQMIYNYCKKSMIATTTDAEGKQRISVDDAEAWLVSFLNKPTNIIV